MRSRTRIYVYVRVYTCVCVCVCFERFCARVYLPISRERNGTFLVKVFIRFLVKVSNFSAASDTYVYLCIIYHNVSRAVYVYFCYRKASVAREKKKRTARGYRFSRWNHAHFVATRLRHCRENRVITIADMRSLERFQHSENLQVRKLSLRLHLASLVLSLYYTYIKYIYKKKIYM